jgi:hypothetical protein
VKSFMKLVFEKEGNEFRWRYSFWYLLLILFFFFCNKNKDDVPEATIPDLKTEKADVAVKWADMTLYAARFSAFNTPTYCSRTLGYIGLTMYQSIVHGDSSYRSMSGQLNGLTLPLPAAGEKYYWLLALNASQRSILKLLYPSPQNSHAFIHEKIDSLYNAIFIEKSKNINASVVQRSVKWGEDVAHAIYNWSVNDGGDKGYTRNFEPSFVFPSGPSHWVPPARGQTISPYPLHPRWGNNRTFVTTNGTLPVPAIVPYSTDPSSDYYKLYKEVYDKERALTQEEMEIAAWWGDDPTETFSPPGHSYAMATIALKKSDPGILKAAEAYAKTGMAVADAFINCWKAKAAYFNERPSTFVKANINSNWVQFWPEPPFPAFPSGHSTQIFAAATVLTNVFGDNFSFTDHSHEGHRRYDDIRFFGLRYPARSYNSFLEAALECGYSRILGGIHTQQDNQVGMSTGQSVGQNINSLRWKN